MKKTRINVLIAGYAAEGRLLKALVLGAKHTTGILFCGLCENGFEHPDVQQKLRALLAPLEIEFTALEHNLSLDFRIHWVKPVLVAEVEYTSKTTSGLLFHPEFLWLREDQPSAHTATTENN